MIILRIVKTDTEGSSQKGSQVEHSHVLALWLKLLQFLKSHILRKKGKVRRRRRRRGLSTPVRKHEGRTGDKEGGKEGAISRLQF